MKIKHIVTACLVASFAAVQTTAHNAPAATSTPAQQANSRKADRGKPTDGAAATRVAPFSEPGVKFEGGISVSDVKTTPSMDSIRLVMTISVSDRAVPKDQSMALVPVVTNGSNLAEFPYVLVNSKFQHENYKRQLNYKSAALMARPPKKVSVASGDYMGESIDYDYSIKREAWMDGGTFRLRYELISPAGERNYFTTVISTSPPAPPVVVEKVVYKQAPSRQTAAAAPAPVPAAVTPATVPPPVVTKGSHTYSGNAMLDFESGQSTLLPDYKRNPAQLAAIKGVMNIIQNNPGTKISKLEIVGCASPDGSSAGNDKLASGRANAFAAYLQKTYGITASQMKVSSIGEDWDGLRQAVENTPSIPYQTSVLAVIDGTDSVDVKESKLKAIAGGRVWQMLVGTIFPRLRRVTYSIAYVVSD